MSLPSAAVLLWTASIRNLIRRQAARLKKPQYLAGTLVGAMYFWSLFFRRSRWSFGASSGAPPAGLLEGIELCVTAIGLGFVVLTWVLGNDRAELSFSEAEVQFLFAGPVSRRQLVHYKLVRNLARVGLSAAASTVFFGWRLTPHWPFFFFGAWASLSALSLHLIAASLTRSSLVDHGRAAWRRKWGTALGIVAVVGAAFVWASHVQPPPSGTPDAGELADWFTSIVNAAPLSWVLAPIRAPIHLALAQSPLAFIKALPGALAVLAVHYVWVTHTDASFEEASAEAASARARKLERRRGGRWNLGATSGRRFRLALASRGAPELAIAWKNIIAARRVVLPNLALAVGVMLLAGVVATVQSRAGNAVVPALASVFSAIGVGWLIVFGPTVMRVDFREDLPQLDLLRALPLSGARIAFAELLAPVGLLAAMQWALIAFSLIFSAPAELWLPRTERTAIALSVALVGPALSALGLSIHNAAALLFPAWVTVDRRQSRGIEALGQRLLTLAGTLLVMGVGLIPAAALAGGTWWLTRSTLGPWAFVPAAVLATGVICFEVAAALPVLGRLFEAFDVSE